MPESQDPTAQRIDRIGYDCAMRTASERHSDGSTICNNRLASPGTCKLTDRHWAVHSFGLPGKNTIMATRVLGLFMAQTDGAKGGIGATMPRVFGMGWEFWNGEGWLIYFVCYWNQAVLSSESSYSLS